MKRKDCKSSAAVLGDEFQVLCFTELGRAEEICFLKGV